MPFIPPSEHQRVMGAFYVSVRPRPRRPLGVPDGIVSAIAIFRQLSLFQGIFTRAKT